MDPVSAAWWTPGPLSLWAGTTVAFWANTTVVHLIVNGVWLKTVPSRLTVSALRWLLDDGGRPAGPPPIRRLG